MNSFELTCSFPVSSSTVYNAWLDSEGHSLMTGGMAAIEEKVDSFFTAWDGYITGKIIEFEPGKRIIQSWRTTEFPTDADNSQVEISLTDQAVGCALTLKHSNIPKDQLERYKKGWESFYFEPMSYYFTSLN